MHSTATSSKQNNAKPPLPIVRYLLYLLLVTTAVTGASFSRYATSSSANDTARVASLNIEVTPDWAGSNRTDMPEHFYSVGTAGAVNDCSFIVTNHSEAALRMRLVVEDEIAADYETAWVELDIGESSTLTADIPVGTSLFSNDAFIHVEYEQID